MINSEETRSYAEIMDFISSFFISVEVILSKIKCNIYTLRWGAVEEREKEAFIFSLRNPSSGGESISIWQKRRTALRIVESSSEQRNKVSAITFNSGTADLWTLYHRCCFSISRHFHVWIATPNMHVIYGKQYGISQTSHERYSKFDNYKLKI